MAYLIPEKTRLQSIAIGNVELPPHHLPASAFSVLLDFEAAVFDVELLGRVDAEELGQCSDFVPQGSVASSLLWMLVGLVASVHEAVRLSTVSVDVTKDFRV